MIDTVRIQLIQRTTRTTLFDLVDEKAALTTEMAFRIEKVFGVEMDTLLRAQTWFDAVLMRERASEVDVERYVPSKNSVMRD